MYTHIEHLVYKLFLQEDEAINPRHVQCIYMYIHVHSYMYIKDELTIQSNSNTGAALDV